MAKRPTNSSGLFPRALLAAGFMGFAMFAGVAPVSAALLPPGFFDFQMKPGSGGAAVEADHLTYDGKRDIIAAEGDVVMSYQGYVIKSDRLEYNQKTGEMHALGHVHMLDPGGNAYEMGDFELTNGMKMAILSSMTLTTPEGALVTAAQANYATELQTILTDATYSPCGLCIDEKGRRIGWKIKSARFIYDKKNASVTLEQPSLELLGYPVAWLPWFWIPDPSQPRATGLRMPSVDYDPENGATLTVPYFVPAGEDTDIIFSPELMSRQGFLMRGDLTWRLPAYGEIEVRASGLYQLDKSAYAGTVGFRDWRGAIQTSGHFVPVKDWTAGWSYSVFSDNGYLGDYELNDADSSTNQVYSTYLTAQTWVDARIQRFNRLGNYADDDKQGMNVPVVKFDHVQDLDNGWGRLHFNGELLGVRRDDDATATVNAVPYVFGYAGNKAHAMVEGAWEDQFILPGGLAATPYVGARLDGAWYDGASSLGSAPPASVLLSATPIAAMDLRWPLVAVNGADTHMVEPIAQLVYRGSSTTSVGITNDDAQGFVFDTANLFSYNRFSGIDRQETGLRANVGAHYLGNFSDGSWLDLIAGESFHLLGVNAMGIGDASQTGIDTGLGSTASYIVASARGGWTNGFGFSTKAQLDPSHFSIVRAGAGVTYVNPDHFRATANYVYIAASPTLGTLVDRHEISGGVAVPVFDYWTLSAGLTYDLAGMTWTKASGGATYDDGYLVFGASGNATPTSWGVGFNFGLKGPDGSLAF